MLRRVRPRAPQILAWLVPIVISLFALYNSWQARLESQAESVLVQVTNYVPWIRDSVGQNYQVNLRSVVATDGTFVPPLRREILKKVLVDNYWSCLVSNVGSRAVSIVAFQVHRDGSPDRESAGFFKVPDQAIELPITLEPGASRRVLLRTTIELASPAIDVLYRRDKLDHKLTFDDLVNTLLAAGMDQYGNAVRIVPAGDGRARFDIDLTRASQERFRLQLKTGNGKYFQDDFWWYKGPQF